MVRLRIYATLGIMSSVIQAIDLIMIVTALLIQYGLPLSANASYIILYIIIALGLFSFILMLTSLWGLSKMYGSKSIFTNALLGITVLLTGILIVTVLYLPHIPYSTQRLQTNTTGVASYIVQVPLTALLIYWASLYAIVVIYGFLMRKSYHTLSNSSNINEFRTTGDWYLYGSLMAGLTVGIAFLVTYIYLFKGFMKILRES